MGANGGWFSAYVVFGAREGEVSRSCNWDVEELEGIRERIVCGEGLLKFRMAVHRGGGLVSRREMMMVVVVVGVGEGQRREIGDRIRVLQHHKRGNEYIRGDSVPLHPSTNRFTRKSFRERT